MDMVPYSTLFPVEAKRFTRELICAQHPILADHPYQLIEHYCVEPGCNCRKVSIWVYDEEFQDIPAILDHSLDKPEGIAGGSQTTLNPWVEPGARALAMLAEVRKMMTMDPDYRRGIEQRYHVWRQAVDNPAHRLHPLVRSYWASTARPRADRRNRGKRFDYIGV